MRRQIIIRSTFARTLDQKFSRGQKVFYTNSQGAEYPGTIVGVGKQKGDVVYDVQLDYPGAKSSILWGYEDQFRTRDAKDGIGTAEEVAYGEGYHSQRSDPCPYTSPELRKVWEKGRAVAKTKNKMTAGYFKGEVRGKRFEPAHDFTSERGHIAKVFSSNGKVVATSEPFLSETPAQEWLRKQIDKAARLGYHVTGKVFNGYFDPRQLQKATA